MKTKCKNVVSFFFFHHSSEIIPFVSFTNLATILLSSATRHARSVFSESCYLSAEHGAVKAECKAECLSWFKLPLKTDLSCFRGPFLDSSLLLSFLFLFWGVLYFVFVIFSCCIPRGNHWHGLCHRCLSHCFQLVNCLIFPFFLSPFPHALLSSDCETKVFPLFWKAYWWMK